ncbi:MAG: GFA family protein [Rhodothalassiaceae bacterium]
MTEALRVHKGGCHCGAIRFEIEAPARLTVLPCNCSICRMSGFDGVIVKAARFRLMQGADQLTDYRFNTGKASHPFCRVCGIKSFYYPRSNPEGVSVNLHCLDEGTVEAVTQLPEFDGRNWEAAMAIAAPHCQ